MHLCFQCTQPLYVPLVFIAHSSSRLRWHSVYPVAFTVRFVPWYLFHILLLGWLASSSVPSTNLEFSQWLRRVLYRTSHHAILFLSEYTAFTYLRRGTQIAICHAQTNASWRSGGRSRLRLHTRILTSSCLGFQLGQALALFHIYRWVHRRGHLQAQKSQLLVRVLALKYEIIESWVLTASKESPVVLGSSTGGAYLTVALTYLSTSFLSSSISSGIW